MTTEGSGPGASTFEQIERILIQSAEHVLACHDRPSRASRSGEYNVANAEDVVVATIGFAAEKGRGSITLVASYGVVEALRPAEVSSSEALVCDVLGELANMLLGRLKNQLYRRGVTLFVGLPTKGLARTMRLQRSGDDGTRSAWHRFELNEGSLFMRLDALFDSELPLTPEDEIVAADDDSNLLGAEGEMMFFDGGM